MRFDVPVSRTELRITRLTTIICDTLALVYGSLMSIFLSTDINERQLGKERFSQQHIKSVIEDKFWNSLKWNK